MTIPLLILNDAAQGRTFVEILCFISNILTKHDNPDANALHNEIRKIKDAEQRGQVESLFLQPDIAKLVLENKLTLKKSM